MTDTYVIYTQPNCGFCDKAKALLEQYGYEHIEMPLPEHKKRLLQLYGEAKTVPQVFYDDILIGGYEELKQRIDSYG